MRFYLHQDIGIQYGTETFIEKIDAKKKVTFQILGSFSFPQVSSYCSVLFEVFTNY